MMKQGVEMSIQTMIVAALAILILVVLIVIFTNQTSNVTDTINACEDRGNAYTCETSCGENQRLYQRGGCDDGEVCCVEESSLI
jgi:hypothetical protein